MTVILTAIYEDMIVMTVDSAITRIFASGNEREYADGRKAYPIPGIGIVATWGARDGNRIGEAINRIPRSSIEELARSVYDYLRSDFQPHSRNSDDVGYHIAGFNGHGDAEVFHAFYGIERPSTNGSEQDYRFYPTPSNEKPFYLFNGRNDLVAPLIAIMWEQFRTQSATRLDIREPVDRVLMNDLIVRFCAEITPEVGPPFYTLVCDRNNNFQRVKNSCLAPLNRLKVASLLQR